MSNEVSLPQACRIVGKGYQWVYSRLLSGDLQGRQVDGRFWVVDRRSAERLRADAGKLGASKWGGTSRNSLDVQERCWAAHKTEMRRSDDHEGQTMTRPTVADLQRNRVTTFGPHSMIPGWKEDAAAWGIRFVMSKVFGSLQHPSGHKPSVKWFAGPPAESIGGLTNTLDPGTIWLSAKLASWEQVIEAAAHEAVHTYNADHGKEHYHDHELPTLVGQVGGRALGVQAGGVREVGGLTHRLDAGGRIRAAGPATGRRCSQLR
jgi:hypothetical protein